MEEAERDTYEVLFDSLRHPLRRRLLRELSLGPRSFSDLKRLLGIDSSHLSYHIRKMGELVSKHGGRYSLTGLGMRALRLLGGDRRVVRTAQTHKVS